MWKSSHNAKMVQSYWSNGTIGYCVQHCTCHWRHCITMQNEYLHVAMDLDIHNTQCYKRWLLLVWLCVYTSDFSFGLVRFGSVVWISHHSEYSFCCIHEFYNSKSGWSWRRKEKSPQYEPPMDWYVCTFFLRLTHNLNVYWHWTLTSIVFRFPLYAFAMGTK